MTRTILITIFILKSFLNFSQLTVDTTLSVEYLVDKILVGNGIRMGNIQCKTDKQAIGYFKCPDNKIGIKSGLIIASGQAANAVGPNNSPGSTTFLRLIKKKRMRIDKDIRKISHGSRLYDISIIEFDFIPLYNKVVFEYSFGSEEYKEYVGSQFNDVFGFFVSGPEMKQKNVALLPNDKNAVTINNVNQKKNKIYFIDNDPFLNNKLFKSVSFKPRLSFWQKLSTLFSKKTKQGDSVLFYTKAFKSGLDPTLLKTFQYDGFTKKMKVIFFATPYEKYHIKIAIADAGDAAFDSGVFLEEKSFVSFTDSLDPNYLAVKKKKSYTNFDSIFGNNKVIPILEPENYEVFENTIINFGSDSFIIPDSCKKKLDDLAAFMRKNQKLTFSITGYTDNTGKEKKNKELSEKRAASVMYYLTERGVERQRLNYLGYSSDNPIGDNKTEQGKAVNRRVEIELDE
ncbi:MAG: OmpA family protein [Bacteroidia bacterium]|nr:OmpA family protein [Bacteroidia bacterium]